MNVCRTCKTPIAWATTVGANARPIPLDLEPDAGGNIVVVGVTGERLDGVEHELEAIVLTRAELEALDVVGERLLYRSHFATCPHADTHRKRRPA